MLVHGPMLTALHQQALVQYVVQVYIQRLEHRHVRVVTVHATFAMLAHGLSLRQCQNAIYVMLDCILWVEHYHARIAMLGHGHQLLERQHHHGVLNAVWGHGQVPLVRKCFRVFPVILVHGLTVLERQLPPNVTHAMLVRGLALLVLQFHHNATLVMLVHGRQLLVPIHRQNALLVMLASILLLGPCHVLHVMLAHGLIQLVRHNAICVTLALGRHQLEAWCRQCVFSVMLVHGLVRLDPRMLPCAMPAILEHGPL